MVINDQAGKTRACLVEIGYHLSGEYPIGWDGRKFSKPLCMWVMDGRMESHGERRP
jgi:hypothetical protein